MASFKALRKKLSQVNDLNKLENLTKQIILADQSLKYEKVKEFEKGIRPDGSKIGDYRNSDYAAFKQSINPKAGGHVDLMLTGKFAGGMEQVAKGQGTFVFKSLDSKSEMLQGRYGKDIMGLNQETFNEKQKNDYAPKLIKEIKRITGL